MRVCMCVHVCVRVYVRACVRAHLLPQGLELQVSTSAGLRRWRGDRLVVRQGRASGLEGRAQMPAEATGAGKSEPMSSSGQ